MMFRIGLKVALAVSMAATVSGCAVFGSPADILSGKRSAPDEFQVLVRKPLRMPGSLNLPAPRPGEPSPLEPDPERDAVVALMGVSNISEPATGTSPGEQALLSAANASASNRELALELEQTVDDLEAQQPYEPPTLVELLSGTDQEEIEDPIAASVEARRLQSEGVAATPVDPFDVPEGGRQATSSGPEISYPRTDRRPNNRLPVEGTTTAF